MNATPGPLFALALASISLIGPLAVHLFMPVIPAVKAALGLSDAMAQLTFSIALFTMAFATLVYGSLSDRYGRRPVLLSGLLPLFLIGSAISLAADSVFVLVIGRLVQAIGAGCGITLVRAIAQDVYGAARLVTAIAYLTMFYTLGPMVSPMVGGILIDAFGWRSVFSFALLLGSIISVAAYLAVFESRAPTPANRTHGNVLRNYFELFRHARFTAFVLQTGFSTASFLVAATAASSLMKEMLHRPSTEFGIYFLLFPFGFLSGNFITSRIGNRVANETMVLAGSLLSLAAVTTQSVLLLTGHVTPLTLCSCQDSHHHGAGHIAVLRTGRRHGDKSETRGHRGRRRRVRAELLRRGVRAIVRCSGERYSGTFDHDDRDQRAARTGRRRGAILHGAQTLKRAV